MPSIAFYVTWKQLGFYVLLYLAALQNVGKELYEAASVDGAGQWAQFRNVTVAGRSTRHHAGRGAGDHHRLQPVHRAVPADGRGRSQRGVVVPGADHVPDAASSRGTPDAAAAIGVILVIFVGVVGLVARRVSEGSS